jgi:hypothetical protein
MRRLACLGGAVLALALGACGGDDSGSAEVGDCIDDGNQVVDCSSSSATKELVSDQSEENAIACIQIGDKPQEEVTVGDKTFCAEEL